MAVTTTAVIAGAALAATAVSGYMQYESSKDAAAAQQQAATARRDADKERQALGSANQQIGQRRSTRQAVREERIRRARIMQASQNTGVGGSSGQFGSTAALGTLTASNVSNIRGAPGPSSRIAGFNNQIFGANQRAADAGTTGQMWGGIGQLSGAAFGAAGGFGSLWQNSGGQGSPIQGGFTNEIWTP